ncbi:hypothetical protein JCM19237_347 [Photobacterium aphoticum]|uniref:Uncharacterized protein n=1 Tax=Photobacterium aphoticum TaxID=754436 RepID=A0A090RKF9_9GAMM|nr:hypothetical protein JCM19237_347 [Photobacterium aphoticum]
MYRFTQNNNAITHDGMTVPIAMLHRAGLESFKQAYENGDVLPYETESEARNAN